MDLQMLVFLLEAFLCASLIHSAPVSEKFVVSVTSKVKVHTNLTVTLPCWLSPQQSAGDMEVTWYYEDKFEAPVMLYKDKTFKTVDQHASYKERVLFGQKDASSGGLKDGDVTLELVNVTLADAGKYTCYVSSDQHHDRADLHLFVTRTGAPPLLAAVVKEDTVNVSCESEGWYPEPQLQWSDGSRALTHEKLFYSKDRSGLVSVHSWLLVSSSSAVSCSVGLSGEETVVGRMRVEAPSPQAHELSGSSMVGWVLFAIVAVFALALLGFLFFKKHRGKDRESKTVDAVDGEYENLLPKAKVIDLSALQNDFYANITLEKGDNEFITVKDNKLRDARRDHPDGITCLTAVRGTPGFSSGKHYWEVSLVINGNGDVPPKQSWWIGVTSLSVIPKEQYLSPTTDNGFWFLSSSRDDNDKSILQFSTNPDTFLGVPAPPQKIGVYLDYEGGRLTFYNLDNRSLIGAFPVKLTREVFPLFNPGVGEKAPMEIIQKKSDAESNDMANTTSEETH